GWNHADNVAGGEPFQFVPRSNPILISNCLGHSQLKFAGHFRHVLTLSRITSLIKSDLLPSWASRNLTTANLLLPVPCHARATADARCGAGAEGKRAESGSKSGRSRRPASGRSACR